MNYIVEHPGEFQYIVTPEEEKTETNSYAKNKRTYTCDEIFAEYLGFVAKKVNKTYYIQLQKFVLFFRDCTNINSEYLKEESKSMPKDLFPEMEPGYHSLNKDNNSTSHQEDYCSTHNAEQLPDISNKFVVNYMQNKKQYISIKEIMELTQNFCQWLFNNGFTCAKLSLIQEDKLIN